MFLSETFDIKSKDKSKVDKAEKERKNDKSDKYNNYNNNSNSFLGHNSNSQFDLLGPIDIKRKILETFKIISKLLYNKAYITYNTYKSYKTYKKPIKTYKKHLNIKLTLLTYYFNS